MTTTGAPDPRVNAFRPDLADERLRGRIEATRYTAGERYQVVRAVVPLKTKPSTFAGTDSELLYGERVTAFDFADGWAWVQLVRDGYVGYVQAEALSRDVREPTHRVQALGTFVYPVADIKAPPLMHLSLGSELTVASQDDRFAKLVSGAFVIGRHIVPVERSALDFVSVAERFIGVPYLWGGRTRMGLDCSGLVQLALEASGRSAPRDSDMQQAGLGDVILIPSDHEGLERGDLVFWRGHVGIMTDSVLMVHANAHHMCVAVEPLVTAAERSKKAGQPIAANKRLAKAPAAPASA